jgi:hypothetical protein
MPRNIAAVISPRWRRKWIVRLLRVRVASVTVLIAVSSS